MPVGLQIFVHPINIVLLCNSIWLKATYRQITEADRTRFYDACLWYNTNEPHLHSGSYSNCRMRKGWSTDEYVATVNPNADTIFPIECC